MTAIIHEAAWRVGGSVSPFSAVMKKKVSDIN
jgi:hypothetical protein